MTRPLQALTVLYGAAFIFLSWAAAVAIEHRAWLYAAAFYAVAILTATAGFRETAQAATHRASADWASHLQAGTADEDAAAIARADLSGACACEHWWTSLGTEHDQWCPTLKEQQ